ncbi:MAG: DUF4124 domain-containing protein [Gammaproteobacteria bacterium]
MPTPRLHSETFPAARLLGALLIGLLLAGSLEAGKLYRWTDAEGRVHYSDRVPPEHVEQAHDRLNTQGMAVEHLERAKTAEEIAREQELARLRSEQQRILEEQRARDEVLLKTFRSEEDLELARQGKLAAVNAQISLAQNNIKRLKARLAEMQASAARTERKGEKVNPKLQANLSETRAQIERNYDYIVQREQEKLALNARFDRDLKRFRTLSSLSPGAPTQREQAETTQVAKVEELVACANAAECERFWERARGYAAANATTELQVNGDRIYMYAAPAADQDVSLTVSRIPGKEGAGSIFLDVQCRETTYCREFCAGEQVRQIRRGFRAALQTSD